MKVWLVLPLLVLAACLPQKDAGDTYRNPDAPIASTTRLEVARFLGEWHVVARVGAPGDPAATTPAVLNFMQTGPVLTQRQRFYTCNDWECVFHDMSGPVHLSGPGRIAGDVRFRKAEMWVLWVDDGFRTAVVGEPEGRFGWIMEKGGGKPSADRLKAAREVLAFNGYNLSRLQDVRAFKE